MLEDTVCALFRAGEVYADLASAPAPSYGIMLSNLLVFCAAACAALLLRAGIVLPMQWHAAPMTMVLAAAAGMILAVPLSFVAAGALHAFMLLSGGAGDFQRSYQAASMFSILIALQALLNWFDWVWPLPALLTAYLGAAAARTIHRAPAFRSGVVFCLLAACCVAGQWWQREQVSRWSQSATAAAQDLSRQLQQMSLPPDPGGGRGAPAASGTGATTALASSQPPGPSSLDLLLSPSQAGGQPASPAQVQAQVHAQAQSLEQATTNMLDPIMAMLQSPALTKGLPPQQSQQLASVTGMLAQMQKSVAGGQKATPEEQAAMMAQFQSAMMRLMTQMQPQAPGPRQGLRDPSQKASPHDQAAPAAQKTDAGLLPQGPKTLQSPEKDSP
jgi:hypothetical protein